MRADLAPRARLSAARPPTVRQALVLDLIFASLCDRGYPPTLRELAHGMGFPSCGAAGDHVQALERKGLLTRASRLSRGLALTASGNAFIEARRAAMTTNQTGERTEPDDPPIG